MVKDTRNKNKKRSSTDGQAFLKQAFKAEQYLLKHELLLSLNSITHNVTMGDVNEDIFIKYIGKYLPDRYAINKGIVIDSEGKTSDQIDVIIYDNQYTPTLLSQEQHRYVPAESVYAIFEAKPTINKTNLEYAGQKAESVRKLKRTSIPIPYAGGSYPAKTPIKIFAGILSLDVEWADNFGDTFESNHKLMKQDKFVDFGFAVDVGFFDVLAPNEYNYHIHESSFGSFIFQLLSKLQSLGTVGAIDWEAYAQNMG